MRHRRRWLHGDPHAARRGHDDRLTRAVARGHGCGRVLRERRAARVRLRALQRPVGRRPRHRRRMGQGAAPLRNAVAAPGAAPRHPRRAARFRRRRDVRLPDRAERRLVRRRALDRRALPRPRRNAARRRQPAAQPGPGADLPPHRPPRRARLLRGADRDRDRRRGPAPAARAGRRPRLASRPADRVRPRRLPSARARSNPRPLPRPRRLEHGAAVERRLHRRRDPQHSRRLRPISARLAPRRCTCSWRRRGWPTRTATPSSPTRPSSTSRSPASCPTSSPSSGAR